MTERREHLPLWAKVALPLVVVAVALLIGSGVFDRARRTQAKSPLGASNVWSMGYGTERYRNV